MKAWSLVLSKEVNVTKEGDHYVDQDGNLWNDFELACLQEDINWQHYHIQAAIAAMQTVDDHVSTVEELAERCVRYADALIAELERKNDVYAEARRLAAINTASVCENMTKLQNELQKKGEQQ